MPIPRGLPYPVIKLLIRNYRVLPVHYDSFIVSESAAAELGILSGCDILSDLLTFCTFSFI